MFAPGVEGVFIEFHSTSITLASFVVSIYVLGYCIGPLFVAPLPEMYGRAPVYHVSNVLYLIFTVACAVSYTIDQGSPCPLATLNPFGRELLL
jgi:MFS family permease